MKLRLTLAAAIATGLMCGTAMAQTTSPNPNKAQNSDMRTQGGTYVYPSGTYMYSDGTYAYPSATYVYPSNSASTVWVVPGTVLSEPMAGTRNIYVPSGPNNTPNPNRVQNNGVPTQYDTYYIWSDPYIYRSDMLILP